MTPEHRTDATLTAGRAAGRLAYDDPDSLAQMRADARSVEVHLPRARSLAEAARAAVRPAPSLHFADYPREVTKRELAVGEAAARLTRALHLERE